MISLIIAANVKGTSRSCVNTAEVLDLTSQDLRTNDNGFICTNVQETDLAEHSQDASWYKHLLEIADREIGEIIDELRENDILLIMADHGNKHELGIINIHGKMLLFLFIKKAFYQRRLV